MTDHGKEQISRPSPEDPSSSTPVDNSLHMSTAHEIIFVAIISTAQLLTQAGLGQALAPLPIIGAHFHTANLGQLSWFVASYSLTVGTFILAAGRLGDIYGHKSMFIFGYAWFGLWSVLAGVSYYSTQLLFDFCRALQGIGPAFLLPNALAILGRTYPSGRRKNLVFSIFGAVAPTGFVLGAVFSALFAQLASWAWAYWAMGITCFVMAGLSYFVLPRAEDSDVSKETRSFDLAGSVTGVAGLILINVAWNQGPSVGWSTPYTYILLIIGILLMLLFAFIETRVKQPLVPLKALSGETGFILLCVAAGWAGFGIWIFYLWQFLQKLRGITPLLGSAQFAPLTISGPCAAIVTGLLMSRIPSTMVMTLSLIASTTGLILVATMPVRQTYWAQTFVSMTVLPWGMDMSFPAATLILSESVPKQHQGIAASLVNTVVNYSVSIGLGIAGTVESRVDRHGSDPLRGYRSAWYTGIALGGVGILISLLAACKARGRVERQSSSHG
ncbi:MAG: Low affinity NH4+ transporter [Peltula sp. TS41687]|nr:MAG: Low affinity NH4+ transporter [Peltula sp. TS41687]